MFCYTNLEVWNGGTNNQEAINLEFPLKNGTYVIMQGGDSEIGNAAHRYRTPHSYALDIVELNATGKEDRNYFLRICKTMKFMEIQFIVLVMQL